MTVSSLLYLKEERCKGSRAVAAPAAVWAACRTQIPEEA